MSESILEASKKAKKNGFYVFFKKKSVLAVIIIVVIGAVGWYLYSSAKTGEKNNDSLSVKEWTVKKDDLQTVVEADGKVVSEDGVELSFSVSGDTLEVSDVFVKEGDKIKKGDKIASVRTDDLNYDLSKAYQNYQSVLANYNDKIAGPTEKEKADAKNSIEQADLSLDQAKINLEKTISSADEKLDTAEREVSDAKKEADENKDENTSESVRDAYGDLADSLKSINIVIETILLNSDKIIGVDNKAINDDFEANLGAKDIFAFQKSQGTYVEAKIYKDELNDLSISLNRYSTYAEIEKAAETGERLLATAESHLYQMQKMLDATIVSSSLSQTQIDGYKSTVNSGRTTVNTKITELDSRNKAINDAKDSLSDFRVNYNDALKSLEQTKRDNAQDIANSESSVKAKEISLANAKRTYDELFDPISEAELASARSSLVTASVNLDKARNDLAKAILISPIDGEIALLNYKAGDIILSNDQDPVAVIINNDTLFVELDVEESDISKLSVGQKANAVFDSLEGMKLDGEIIFISQTAETSNNGIVTYLVRVVLKDTAEQKIRQGMTAAVEFIVSGVADVLQAPVSAVRNVNGKPSVQMKNGEWAVVETGYTDGKYVEIISGLKAGDVVIY